VLPVPSAITPRGVVWSKKRGLKPSAARSVWKLVASLEWIVSVVLAGGLVVVLFDLWYRNDRKIRAEEPPIGEEQQLNAPNR
jgi:hypothetical protein